MKKLFIGILILLLIVLKYMGAGYAEGFSRWVYDPRVTVEVVDHMDENGSYNVYYCIGEEFVVTLIRDVYRDEGWITMTQGGIGESRLWRETDWGGRESADRIIDDWVTEALSLVGE